MFDYPKVRGEESFGLLGCIIEDFGRVVLMHRAAAIEDWEPDARAGLQRAIATAE